MKRLDVSLDVRSYRVLRRASQALKLTSYLIPATLRHRTSLIRICQQRTDMLRDERRGCKERSSR
eukprot:767760-Hanusia_phi.AAC.5